MALAVADPIMTLVTPSHCFDRQVHDCEENEAVVLNERTRLLHAIQKHAQCNSKKGKEFRKALGIGKSGHDLAMGRAVISLQAALFHSGFI